MRVRKDLSVHKACLADKSGTYETSQWSDKDDRIRQVEGRITDIQIVFSHDSGSKQLSITFLYSPYIKQRPIRPFPLMRLRELINTIDSPAELDSIKLDQML